MILTTSELYLPKTLKVGYQYRDTKFEKKIGYVIYYDHTGKLRKETSWENWRDKQIDSNEFENIPTEGFMIHSNIKDKWSQRQEYLSIYDPRGFEFEITIDNFIYIIQHCNIINTGIVGKLVYVWKGADLILMPTADNTTYSELSKLQQSLFAPKGQVLDLISNKPYIIKVGSTREKWYYLGTTKLINGEIGKSTTKLIFYDHGHKVCHACTKNDVLAASDSTNNLSEDILSDIWYRFQKSAYTADFWKHPENYIDHFEDSTAGKDLGLYMHHDYDNTYILLNDGIMYQIIVNQMFKPVKVYAHSINIDEQSPVYLIPVYDFSQVPFKKLNERLEVYKNIHNNNWMQKLLGYETNASAFINKQDKSNWILTKETYKDLWYNKIAEYITPDGYKSISLFHLIYNLSIEDLRVDDRNYYGRYVRKITKDLGMYIPEKK
jgi:hypothetical protein cdifQCD_20116